MGHYSNAITSLPWSPCQVLFQRGITVGSDVQNTADLVFTEFPKVFETDATGITKPSKF